MKHRGGGFTLLETLAALALLVIVITVMLAAFAQARRSLTQVRDSDRLSEIARTLLDEQRQDRVQAGVTSGGVSPDIRWVKTVTRLPSGQGELPLFRLELTLKGRGTAHWQLVTLIAQRRDISEPVQ
jgi:general secretion pathway protein I